MARWMILCLFSVIILVIVRASLVSADGQCIKGKYHKPKPSPANKPFKACYQYRTTNSCCKSEFTVELAATRTEKLYNHTWDICKPLSAKCLEFWMHQECFYQCSPYLYKWAHPKVQDGVHGKNINCDSRVQYFTKLDIPTVPSVHLIHIYIYTCIHRPIHIIHLFQ
ncbi:riboflavin-binding protein-like [Actinia tenebrosa]|uniref:Riboflavin-binding protein-like n=1 Tax=Actinia tenebrosa TaxID=6105 RepID=A0A6P8IG46_ACTTE|nr:riboflavin-binding protein-like [Actinia tenebrosa]